MIYLDIETVPNEGVLLSPAWIAQKARRNQQNQDAALSPAFGKVVCVCAHNSTTGASLRACGPDERDILHDLRQSLDPMLSQTLCGHNIKRFDVPFLACRYLAHGMPVPTEFAVAGKKPWEVPHIDTCEWLRFGGGDAMSIDAACLMLGIPSPKSGSVSAVSVWDAYQRGDHEGIATYCAADVEAVRAILGRMRGLMPRGL